MIQALGVADGRLRTRRTRISYWIDHVNAQALLDGAFLEANAVVA
jgi:hypothetical protein